MLDSLTGGGTLDGPLLRLGAVGAGAAKLVNNPPAYLALEVVASHAPARLLALLVGVKVGPLATVWAARTPLIGAPTTAELSNQQVSRDAGCFRAPTQPSADAVRR